MGKRPSPLTDSQQQDSLFFSTRARPVSDHAQLTAADQVLLVNAAAKPLTVVLPKAASVKFRAFVVIKIDGSTNPVTLIGGAGALIEGAITRPLTAVGEVAEPWSDGTQYFLLTSGGAGPPGPPGPPGIPGPPGPTVLPHEEDPAGARPGTAFTLTGAPSVLFLRHNTLWLIKAGALTDINQFLLAGNAITTFDTILPGDDFHAVWF